MTETEEVAIMSANIKKTIDFTSMKTVLLLAGFCCFLWGSATPAIKIGYQMFQIESTDTSSILLFAGVRFVLAGFLVILYHSIVSKKWIVPPKKAGMPILNLALSQTILQYFFFYVGLSHATGVHGAIITGTNVFISILFASLIFRYEKLTGRKVVGCLFGFAGIVIMNLSGSETGSLFQVSFLGEGFVLLAQVFYAVSGALIKKYSTQYNVVMLSGYQFMAGGAVLSLIGALGGGTLMNASGIEAGILLLYMGFISAAAYTIWGILLKYNPVSRVTVFGFMNPMFGVLLSAIFLRETGQALSLQALAALIFVCLGIYVVNGGKIKWTRV